MRGGTKERAEDGATYNMALMYDDGPRSRGRTSFDTLRLHWQSVSVQLPVNSNRKLLVADIFLFSFFNHSSMDSIDDIFDSKGKSASLQPLASSSKQPDKKKKKDKKKKRTEEPSDPEPKPLSKKRRVPETVVDPSTTIPSAKRAKVAAAPSQKVQKPKKKDDSKEEEDRFKDSRGSGPRTFT